MTDEMIDPEKLRALQVEIERLPRAIDPPDVWPDIRAALQRAPVTAIDSRSPRHVPIKFWQRPVFLAAAAAALVASTTATTIIAMRERPAYQTVTADPARTPASISQFESRENNYIETANRLESLVESEQSNLSPETIAKVKESIAIIDAAIIEARQALAADPANKDLVDMLTSSYDKKLDLLRRSAAMGRS